MPHGVSEVRLGHINPENRKLRPDLFERIDKPSCAAADIDNLQLALVPSGKYLMKLRQRLPPDRICRTVKKNFDLRVVQLGRFLRQPAARLIMEILQIITRSFPARGLVQNFVLRAALATPMNTRKIVEENS